MMSCMGASTDEAEQMLSSIHFVLYLLVLMYDNEA